MTLTNNEDPDEEDGEDDDENEGGDGWQKNNCDDVSLAVLWWYVLPIPQAISLEDTSETTAPAQRDKHEARLFLRSYCRDLLESTQEDSAPSPSSRSPSAPAAPLARKNTPKSTTTPATTTTVTATTSAPVTSGVLSTAGEDAEDMKDMLDKYRQELLDSMWTARYQHSQTACYGIALIDWLVVLFIATLALIDLDDGIMCCIIDWQLFTNITRCVIFNFIHNRVCLWPYNSTHTHFICAE